MESFVPIWNSIMAIGTIVWIILAIIILIACIFNTSFGKPVVKLVGKYALWLAGLVAIFSIIGSLVYSDVIGYPACLYCWYQRIVIYPQAIIFIVALWQKKDSVLALWQGLVLSVISIVIGSFQYFVIDIGGKELGSCVAAGVSCSIRYVYEYGFITIPLMGLTAGLLLFGIALTGIIYRKKLKDQLSTSISTQVK